MRTTIVALALLTLVVAATVATADRGYSAYVQQAWREQQAQQMKADQASERIFAEAAKGMPAVSMPDLGTGRATGAAGGGKTRGASQMWGWTTCPGY